MAANMKIKKGDQVQVIAGKDLGAQGRVLQVLPNKQKVLVEGVNQVARHERIRVNRKGGQEGGITHKEAPISASNVALLCPTDGATRVGYRLESDGTKVRVCVKCGTEL